MSTPLLLIRHAATAWNAEKRMQGRSDIPLSTEGKTEAASWRLPKDLGGYDWFTSPLTRARETAALLGQPDSDIEPRLIEMDWGQWEGQRLPDLRQRLGAEMVALEDRGLDFRPPGGESPRDLQLRLRPWLLARAKSNQATVAVTHKGVIRALYALAVGWDMRGKPPTKLQNAACHRFALAPDGTLTLLAANITLRP